MARPEKGNFSALERAASRVVASRPGAWFYVNVTPKIDRPLMRLSRGRIGFAGKRAGILTSTGAKSGQRRASPLVFMRDGENVVLFASRGGDPRNPGWYHNLRANPRCSFYAAGEEREYVALEAQGDERDRLWQRAIREVYPGYATYEKRAGSRRIPVMVLTPAGEDGEL